MNNYIKTLNGYEIVDEQARKDIENLVTEEDLHRLSEQIGNNKTKSSTIYKAKVNKEDISGVVNRLDQNDGQIAFNQNNFNLLCEAIIAAGLIDVAQVGDIKYKNIDDAIAAWTNNTTLTLLFNVTLSDTIQLKSTEHHTLNLGRYTMTAAPGKSAIEITCDGRTAASYALTINADENNPGCIIAHDASCIYYQKEGTAKDRPIITINGGVFNGLYAIDVHSNGGTNCPQIFINDGVFNADINIIRGYLKISGGIFNNLINCTGDSSAIRLIYGGSFKRNSWSSTMAVGSNKFCVGSLLKTYDVGVYVDDDGYLIVGDSVITEPSDQFNAFSTNYAGWSSYLEFSSAAENGIYYTNVIEALKDNNTTDSVVTVYTDQIDLTDLDYTGTINLSENINQLVVTFIDGTEPLWTVTTNAEGKEITFTDDISGWIVTRTYNVIDTSSITE